MYKLASVMLRRRGGRNRRTGAAALLVAVTVLAAGGCRTYPITYNPNIRTPDSPAEPAALAPLEPASTLPAVPPTSSAPATTEVPATTTAPVTTVRPAAPPATAARPAVPTAPPPVVYHFPGSVSPAVAAVAPAVVDIDAADGVQHAFGTGMVLTTSGQILTNNHVVRGARTITVTSVNTGRAYRVTVVGTDAVQDVAMLQMQNPAGLVTFNVGGSVNLGDPVTAIGNTYGRGGTPSIRTGSVVATGQSLEASDGAGAVEHLNNLIEISAAAQPGDSGGPVADASGRVIGMVVASSGGAGYAIPISTVMAVVQQVQTGH